MSGWIVIIKACSWALARTIDRANIKSGYIVYVYDYTLIFNLPTLPKLYSKYSTGFDIICAFGASKSLARPYYLTVQVGDRQHIMLEPEFLQYINHSCAPNVFFDGRDRVVKAINKIEIGEELTFFYPSTEWSMDREFDCNCQSKNCLGTIRGAAYLPLDILTKYQIAQHIQQRLLKRVWCPNTISRNSLIQNSKERFYLLTTFRCVRWKTLQ